jgi:hypothetical protein
MTFEMFLKRRKKKCEMQKRKKRVCERGREKEREREREYRILIGNESH